MKLGKILTASAIAIGISFSGSAFSAAVNITPKLESVSVSHGGKSVKIMRNQNQKNTVNPAFAKTSRKCPPFCIQPSTLAPGVETIAEVEMLDYLTKMSNGDSSILMIEDGVYGAMKGTAFSEKVAAANGVALYVLGPDMQARGISEDRLLDGVKVVDYAGFVDLVTEHDKVQAWL